MYDKDTIICIKKLQGARLSLMKKQPFYAVLLLHMQFSLDPMCETAYTDGKRIAFCPDYLLCLSDTEIEFILMHEVLHAALDHIGRMLKKYDFDDFGTACDIVVNSNIMHSCGDDLSALTLKSHGVGMHLAPDGADGYKYTAEEVYRMIRASDPDKTDADKDTDRHGAGNDEKDDNADISKVKCSDKSENADDGTESFQARKDGGFDDHTYWGEDDDPGLGNGEASSEEGASEDGESTGNGQNEQEGGSANATKNSGESGKEAPSSIPGDVQGGASDMRHIWLIRMVEAAQVAKQISIRKGGKSHGTIPLCAERLIKELTEPQTDWKTILENFIQEEINDYSFNPPDRRFQDSPFLLPDYNEKDDSVKDLLFMIDTSASMSDQMITQAYSEIKGAIDQFDGHLTGWLGFFDAAVVEPKEFTTEDEFMIIRPKGGGGTSFHCIFKYVKDHLEAGFEPADIIILTDGYAPFPDEDDALGIPVLWLINNEDVQPPWGKVARIKISEER